MQVEKKYRRYRVIADKIIGRINAGQYVPGERLPAERELVEELEVSRPTLREALIALEIMGYIDVRGGSGIYVADKSDNRPQQDLGIGTFELLEARKIIEADIARIAAETMSAEQLRDLREIVETQIKDLEERGHFSDVVDMRFHTLIAEATGNGALLFVVEELWKFRRESDIWRFIDERSDSPSMQVRAVEDHIRICAALESRDADAAFDAMRQHMQNNIDWRLSNLLDVPAVSEKDRRTKLRLRLEKERASDAG